MMQTSLVKDDCMMTVSQLYRPMGNPLGDIVVFWGLIDF
jgi:hypothetical protein